MRIREVSLSLCSLAAALSAQTSPSLCWQRRGWPEYRYDHAMAYDSTRQVVLLFGGGNGQRIFGDTWAWDGTSWQSLTDGQPSPRAQHAMAFDVARNRVVLFGGVFGANLYDDTWEWAGGWRQVAAAASPPARSDHAMAYDYIRGRVVLFGGRGASGTLNDTWEWTGSTWQQILTGTSPSARERHAMDADPQGLVLFGGAGQVNQTWVLRQGNWQQLTPPTSPPAVADHTLTFQAAASSTLLYTGSMCWDWNGATWTQRNPQLPGGRSYHAAAYDFSRSEVVMFGGYNGYDDTWTWNNTVWNRRELAPSSRDLVPMCAANAQATTLILHGGHPGALSDTWQWDGSAWSRLQPTQPPGRYGHSLTFDPATQRPIMFGGHNGGTPTNTTFDWNGTAWTLLTPAAMPPARYGHADCAVSGAGRSGVMVFGGYGAGYLNDTWLWNGTTWSTFAASSPTPPAGRYYTAMAQEPGRNSVLLFGGDNGGSLGDTWRLDLASQTWTALNPSPAPLAREGHRMVADAARGRILMIGGHGVTDPSWEWDPNTSAWSQIPLTGSGPTGLHTPGLAIGTRGQLVLFGGHDQSSGYTDNTWTVPGYAAARVQLLGTGCGPVQGAVPALSVIGLPFIGNQFTLRVSGLPLTGVPSAVLFLDVAIVSVPLPPCPACTVRVAGGALVTVPAVAGTANLQLAVPCLQFLRNATFHVQGFALHSSFTCLGSLGMTNAASCTVGGY